MLKLVTKNNYTLEDLQQQVLNSWLINYDNFTLLQLTQKLTEELKIFKLTQQKVPIIFLRESEPIKFIASFLATIIEEVPIFIGNPDWQTSELQQVHQLLQPDLVWGSNNRIQPLSSTNRRITASKPLIGIPTGGSSGSIRFAIHDLVTLTASVKGFIEYFATASTNFYCTLPLYHVSGLMQLWRSLITGGHLAIVPYSDLKQGIKPNIEPQDYFLSLVPTQLQWLLNRDREWLSQFKTILLGGAPPWRSLLERAKHYNIPVATTYGMTETASGVTYLKPQDFLRGNYSSGKVLPHAKVEIVNDGGEVLEPNQVGTIKIEANSLYYGYYPQYSIIQKPLITNDLGLIDSEGFLHIIGRSDRKIITGGENVYPQEVEAAILATNLVEDVCVIGLNDRLWGQVVTALFVPSDRSIRTTAIAKQLEQQISNYKQPKYWLQLDSLLRDIKGKVNYSVLTEIAQELIEKQK